MLAVAASGSKGDVQLFRFTPAATFRCDHREFIWSTIHPQIRLVARASDKESIMPKTPVLSRRAAFASGDYTRAWRYLAAAPDTIPGVVDARQVTRIVLDDDPLAPRLSAGERRNRLSTLPGQAADRLAACSASLRQSEMPFSALPVFGSGPCPCWASAQHRRTHNQRQTSLRVLFDIR